MSAENEPDYIQPEPDPEVKPEGEKQPEPLAEQLAFERGRSAALEEQLKRQPQPGLEPQRPAPEAPLPTNPLDLLDAAGKERLAQVKLIDRDAYDQEFAALNRRLSQLQTARDARPILQINAKSMVDSFKTRMAMDDPAYYKDVAPLFDAEMARVGDGILNLLNMTAGQSEQELSLRWNASKSTVMDKRIKNPPKLDPAPINGGGGGPSGGRAASGKVTESDPIIAHLAAKYNFTPEQRKTLDELEKASA